MKKSIKIMWEGQGVNATLKVSSCNLINFEF